MKEECSDECFITSTGMLDGCFLLRKDPFFGALWYGRNRESREAQVCGNFAKFRIAHDALMAVLACIEMPRGVYSSMKGSVLTLKLNMATNGACWFRCVCIICVRL